MLTNKIFNASALPKLCIEQSMLSSKCIYAFYQTSFCLQSNVNMLAAKYCLIKGSEVD